MSPARPGAFNANFAPDTLEAFKALCRQQGKAYTKVLEQFAELYLDSSGTLFDQLSVPASAEVNRVVPASSSITTRGSTLVELLDRVETLEGNGQEFASAFEMLIHRVETLEEQTSSKELERRVEHVEKAVQYKQKKTRTEKSEE